VSGGECALWWFRYASPGYEICDSEQEAADLAAGMMDSGGCSIAGVQFPDGRVIQRDAWAAYLAAEERLFAAQMAANAAQRAKPPAPKRKIRAPFGGQIIKVDPGEPAWLGTEAS
jgi:hypothetical protein